MGAASVFMRKPPSHNEILNDIDGEIANLFRVLREHSTILKDKLLKTPYSREEYLSCHEKSEDNIEQARRTVVKAWLGIGDSIFNKTGFRVSLTQGGATTKPFIKIVDSLDAYSTRLRGAIIENLDYREIFSRYDKPGTLFYIDPPYHQASRSKKHAYRYDWVEQDHKDLTACLGSLKGSCVLSGYENEDYKSLGWEEVIIPTRDQKKDAAEILWIKK